MIIICILARLSKDASGFHCRDFDHGTALLVNARSVAAGYCIFCIATQCPILRAIRTATGDRFSSDEMAVSAYGGTFALALGHDNEGVT
jgi:hypothetical protein